MKPGPGSRRISRLTALAVALPLAAGGETWNVADTGQPGREVAFTVTEGTWMSADVSPDGRWIVFDLLGDIYRMPASGGRAEPIHDGPAMTRTPTFSADGDYIVFLSDASGGDNAWRSRPDGSDAEPLTFETDDVVSDPVLSPDGAWLAATRLSSAYRDLNTAEIRLYHAAGGDGETLIDSPGAAVNVGEPEFSRDGRYLYYTQKVGADGRTSGVYFDANHLLHAVMRRDLRTGETRQLIGGFGGAVAPQASPDGRRVAFVRRVKERTVLFVHDVESGAERPVFDELDRDLQGEWIAQGMYYPRYGWFPDSRNVLIWGKGHLLRIDTDSGAAEVVPFDVTARHQITDVTRFRQPLEDETVTVRALRHLAISSDGSIAVFNAVGRLWRWERNHGETARLTDSPDLEFEPAFSPDGNRLAWVEWNDTTGSRLRVARPDGSGQRTIATSPSVIREPAFGPDGSRLVYRIETDNACMTAKRPGAGLWTVPLDGGAPVRLAGSGREPRFSPDGERIWYLADEYRDGTVITALESIDLDGDKRRRHAVATGSDRGELTPSPDRRWLAFRDRQQYYLTPLPDAGGPLEVSAERSAGPVTALTTAGGYELTWTANSSAVYWLVGNHLHRAVPGIGNSADAGDPPVILELDVPADRPSTTLAFVNAHLIPVAGEPVADGTVIVAGDRIAAAGPADRTPIPPTAIRIDLGGATVMPGLVNMHGHLEDCYYESTGGVPRQQGPLYAALAWGTTTNFDPYASELPSLAVSEMQRAGVTVGPRMFTVGAVLYGRPGKYDPVYTPIDDLGDAHAVMARKRAVGTRLVKSYRQPLRRQRQQIVRAAREAGVMVSIEGESHFYNNISAVLDGHNTVEHNLPVANYYDDVVQLFAHGRTANTPTLVVTFGELLGENWIYQHLADYDDPRIGRYVPEVTSGYSPLGIAYGAPFHARALTTFHGADELWDIGFRSVARATRRLDDAGVLVNVGSHAQVQGLAMHWEMRLMAEGGMPLERILRAATLNGATTLGLEHEIGTLEAGKRADFIVLDRNPLEDIRHTETVRYTVINGRVYDAMSMNEVFSADRPRSRFYWEPETATRP